MNIFKVKVQGNTIGTLNANKVIANEGCMQGNCLTYLFLDLSIKSYSNLKISLNLDIRSGELTYPQLLTYLINRNAVGLTI
jgi:hypothetical protein